MHITPTHKSYKMRYTIFMSKKSVLVIEDSPYLAESLADMLDMHGYEALVAPSGREGVTLAIEKKPDLILLDIRLPDIDGYEVYRRLREDSWGKSANILVLTASESIENISKNINLPVDDILFKPEWSVVDLLAKIDSRLHG
jgi:DNA-binding response OmpR family regulator